MFDSEEDIRSKLLMPYLADLGFDASEITLERSFRLRLGRVLYTVGEQDIPSKGGRLDIACKRNGAYLFVVELKRDGLPLTDEDRDQGISYARLLENIAPFVVVSNGSDTRVFDTITRRKIDGESISTGSAFWRDGCSLSTQEDLSIRHAALVNFIGRSPENLRIFSNSQVASRMGNIAGEAGDIYAKYVKELYVDRDSLDQAFAAFLESSFQVFAITGESGVGKTNAVCHLCESYVGNRVVLFYNAALAASSLLESVAADLNLFFSSRSDTQKVLLELAEACRQMGALLIFVDAIDECPRADFRRELGEIALALRAVGGVKLCVSCKSASWGSFLHIAGQKSYLHDCVYPPVMGATEARGDVQTPGFILTRFHDSELHLALSRYAEKFQLQGVVPPTVKEQLRLGLLLRLFSHVHRGKIVPGRLETIELFSSYLDSVAAKMTGIPREEAVAVLSQVGRMLIESEGRGRATETVDFAALRKELRLSALDEIPTDLFDYNLLVRTIDEGVSGIAFYFSLLRDYVICFHSLALQTLSDDDFPTAAGLLFNGPIGQSVVEFYVPFASSSHREAIARLREDRLEAFAESYDRFLDTQFPAIKHAFDPHTDGPISIMVPRDLAQTPGPYALIPSEKADNRRLVHADSLMSMWDDRVFHVHKARVVHSSYQPLLMGKKEDQVWEYVYSQLKEILEKGRLNEFGSETLLKEQLANIVYFYHRQLYPGVTIEDMYYPRYDAMYPIDLRDLSSAVRRFFAKHYYVEQEVQRLIRTGKIPVNRGSYTYSDQDLDWAKIQAEVETAERTGAPIPEPHMLGHFPPFVHLMKIIRRLIENGVQRLDRHNLPGPDIDVRKARRDIAAHQGSTVSTGTFIEAQFTDGQVRRYIEGFLLCVETAYAEVVDECFPLLKYSMPFYASRPHRYLVRYELGDVDSITIACIKSDGYYDHPVVEFTEDRSETFRRGHGYLWSWVRSASSAFAADYSRLRTVEGVDSPKVDEFCVVREWVYHLLSRDLPHSHPGGAKSDRRPDRFLRDI